MLRLDANGRTRKIYVRRRDLLREYRLQPRDLRRIDPSIDFTKTSPSITIKENVLLLCLGGVRCVARPPQPCSRLKVMCTWRQGHSHAEVATCRALCSALLFELPGPMCRLPAALCCVARRAIVTAEKALLFEPSNLATRRLIDTIVPHLRSKAERNGTSQQQQQRAARAAAAAGNGNGNGGAAYAQVPDSLAALGGGQGAADGSGGGANGAGGVLGGAAQGSGVGLLGMGGGIGLAALDSQNRQLAAASHTEYMARFYPNNTGNHGAAGAMRSPPFELELLEGALIGATGAPRPDRSGRARQGACAAGGACGWSAGAVALHWRWCSWSAAREGGRHCPLEGTPAAPRSRWKRARRPGTPLAVAAAQGVWTPSCRP